MPTFEYVIFSN